MRCEQISELLSAYIDHMTNARENSIIIAHLKSCPDCRRELEELESMAAMLHGLYTPLLPENFAADLRHRLNDEKISILKPRELKRPGKAGWIAAAVAIIALGAGILTSNYLPIDSIIAYQEQQTGQQAVKHSISVEEILGRIIKWDKEDPGKIPVNNEGDIDIANNGQAAPEAGSAEEQPADIDPSADTNAESPDSGIRIADIYSARIKTDNREESINQIIKIAAASNAQYEVVSTDSMVQAFSAGSSQMVELKADPDCVDDLIKEFMEMGMIAAPMHDEIVLSDEYKQTLEQIDSINKQAEEARANNDQVKLKQLNKDLYDWTSRQTVIDNEAAQDTIRIYLVEEINP